MNPLAAELNEQIERASPEAHSLLSERGRRLFWPRGILYQSAQAREKAHRWNATLGEATEAGGPMALEATTSQVPDLAPHRARFQGADAPGRLGCRHVQHVRHGQSEKGVQHRMATGHPQPHGLAVPQEAPVALVVHGRVVRLELGVSPLAPSGHPDPRADPPRFLGKDRRLVTHHRPPVLREPAEQVELLREHALERLQLLDVRFRDRGDDTDLGSRDLGECADLPWLVGAHLQDHHLGVVGRVEEREWQAHPVVEVATGGVEPT